MARWEQLSTVLHRFVDEGTLCGCGLRIYRDGQVIFSECVGEAAADGTLPFTDNTRLRLHSMSKTFTCAGFMTLYEQGLFALDDPISHYLPEFENPMVCVSDTDISKVVPAKTPITIRHLLTMQSGIPYWSFNPGEGIVQDSLLQSAIEMEKGYLSGQKYKLEDLVKIIAQTPLCFHPGEHWLYGLSLTVIGRLIEVLSGKRFADYIREAIWEPLGLTRTCFVQQLSENEEVAELMVSQEICEPLGMKVGEASISAERHAFVASKVDVLHGTGFGIELPCGGMSSTLHDMSKFFAMFANGGHLNGAHILGRSTIDLMRANHLGPNQLPDFTQWENNRGFGYGLGYRTMRSAAEAGFYMPEGSFGWDGACGCYGLANPDHKFAFVFAEQSLPHHISYTIPRVVTAMNADMDRECI